MVLVFFLFLQSMRFEMKNIFLLLLLVFISSPVLYADGGPPPPPGCECCAGLEGTIGDINTPLGFCIDKCNNEPSGNYCGDAVPINRDILIFLLLGVSLGGYFFYKSHKKNLH